MKPTAQQLASARAWGAQRRRAVRKLAACPFKDASSEPLRGLRQAWLEGFWRSKPDVVERAQ